MERDVQKIIKALEDDLRLLKAFRKKVYTTRVYDSIGHLIEEVEVRKKHFRNKAQKGS